MQPNWNLSFLGFFFTPWFLATSFFFWFCAALETLRPLLQNGTRMSSSMYSKISFLRLFLAPDIMSLAFFFRSHADFETLRMLLPHGSRMSSSQNDKFFLFLYFFTNWFLAFFIFDPLPPLKRWLRCWLMGPRCQPPRTRNMWYFILQTINVVFRSELLQTDKLNLYFYNIYLESPCFLFWRSIGLSCFF